MSEGAMSPVNFYKEWASSQGIPILEGYFVEDVYTLGLEPWADKGGNGALINLLGSGESNDAYVCEIPAGKSLKPERHMYEEMIYVLKGRGAASVWVDGSPKQTFEWQEGSLFAPPLNTWHQLHNGQGDEPARFLAVTSAPMVMNLFHNLDFVFDNPFVFKDRYQPIADYFSPKGKMHFDPITNVTNIWESNFIADVNNLELIDWKDRGGGAAATRFELSGNTMASHTSRFAIGVYKKGHRHGPGAHVLILEGKGFSLMWPDGGEKLRFNWKPGSIVVPPEMWWHQHFNAGRVPARYLALRWGSRKHHFHLAQNEEMMSDSADGGHQIEYKNEDPEIRRWFEEALAAEGVQSQMDRYFKQN